MRNRQDRLQPRAGRNGDTLRYRYQDLIDRHLQVHIRTGEEYMVSCLFHDNDGSPAMQINAESGLFVCFNPDCGKRGNIRTLCKALGIKNFVEPEVDVSEIVSRLDLLDSKQKIKTLDPIPESMTRRYSFDTSYWQGRGFTTDTIDAFDLGFDVMHDMATIGLRNHTGQLIGFIRRDMDPEAIVRYKNPKGFERSSNLFGSWLADHTETDTVVLCEGPVDAIAVWQAGYCGVAQFGSSISPAQIRLIRRMGFGRVVLFFDNDQAGRSATNAAMGERSHRRGGKEITEYDPATDLRRDFLVSVASYRGITGKKDPGSMTSKQIEMAIAASRDVR